MSTGDIIDVVGAPSAYAVEQVLSDFVAPFQSVTVSEDEELGRWVYVVASGSEEKQRAVTARVFEHLALATPWGLHAMVGSSGETVAKRPAMPDSGAVSGHLRGACEGQS